MTGERLALVLAGSRGGIDPVAAASGVSHKAFTPLHGVPMITRVVRTLNALPDLSKILVSIERPELLEQEPELNALLKSGRLHPAPAAQSPSRSLLAAFEAHPDCRSWLMTTADNPLLNADMIRHFRATIPTGTEVAVALARRETIQAAYPGSRRTYLKFRDQAMSGCNLFAFDGPRIARVPQFWITMERHRKRPWRMALELGISTTLAFLLRRLTLDEVFQRLSEKVGIAAAAVELPFAEAAIDVDKPADIIQVESILRRQGAPS